MNYIEFNKIENKQLNKLGRRIVNEIKFSLEISKNNNGEFIETISKAIDFFVEEYYKHHETITPETCFNIEKILEPLKKKAKEYSVFFVAHAHMDMNWLWGYNETVAIVLSTVRTMLNFMTEYPDFTFSLSQAAIYEIIEKYDPKMLEEIKQRVKEGRWEVSAATWVEGDKNLANGEGQIRQILYAKRYLCKLFELSPDDIVVDFEPDTFGHSACVPEILSDCGVKYYYHCRGNEAGNTDIYYWEAPSGNKVLAYREPVIYNREWIYASDALGVANFARRNGVNAMLKVYGVGDHGGGATRVEIDNIRDMMEYPIFPTVKFSTYKEYFSYIDKNNSGFPTIKDELNPVFTGCYTSQSRIKKQNRVGEHGLDSTEKMLVYAHQLSGFCFNKDLLDKAWKNHLFNQFHDILPGSGVTETREYAMGIGQERDACLGVLKTKAMQSIISAIDCSRYLVDIKSDSDSRSQGAGVGCGADKGVYFSESNSGNSRLYVLFNTSMLCESFYVRVTLWDYHGNLNSLRVFDCNGESLEYVISKPSDFYWGHFYSEIIIRVKMKPLSYKVIQIDDKKENIEYYCDNYPPPRRTDTEKCHVLENNKIRYEFDSQSLTLMSVFDKEKERYVFKPSGAFYYIEEEASSESSWLIGKYITKKRLCDNVFDVSFSNNAFEQSISYVIKYGNSDLRIKMSLEEDSKKLVYNVESNFFEVAKDNKIPMLSYALQLDAGYKFYNDIPFGVIERKPEEMDKFGSNFCYAKNETDGLMLIADCKFGYRINNTSIALTLLHNSNVPDISPEFGKSSFRFAIVPIKANDNKELMNEVERFNNEIIAVPTSPHCGSLPESDSLFSYIGKPVLSSLKIAEDNTGYIFRFYNPEYSDENVEISFNRNVFSAVKTDCLEREIIQVPVEKNVVKVCCPKCAVVTLKISME